MLHTRSLSVADSFTRGGRKGEGEGGEGEREFLSSASFVATRNVRLTTQWKQQLHDRWWLLDRPTDRPALPILTLFLRPWVQLSSFTLTGQVVIGQPTVRGSVTRKHVMQESDACNSMASRRSTYIGVGLFIGRKRPSGRHLAGRVFTDMRHALLWASFFNRSAISRDPF